MGILYLATAAVLLFVLGGVNAQVHAPDWGQCGGIGWSGPTICGTGYTCTYLNPYHSLCLPVTSTTTPPG